MALRWAGSIATVIDMASVTLERVRAAGAPLAGSEVETLLGFLDYQRAALAWKCADLTDEHLRMAMHPRR